MNIIRFWYRNARPTALPQSLLPAILALCMASGYEGFSIYLGVLAVFGAIMGHLSLNLFDDYYDYKVQKTDFRDRMQHKGMRARIAKCDYLTSGKATLNQLLVACVIMGAVALSAGLVIYLYRGNVILMLAAFAAILGISYSGADRKSTRLNSSH